MSKRSIVLILLAIDVLLLLWAPWLSQHKAEQRVVVEFTAAWQGVVDGCGFNCDGCGVVGSERLVMGFRVEIEYACGLIPIDSEEFHETDIAYVSPFGTVHGLVVP
ncbi:MAG: hypothetical protein PVF70_05835 [Anaerolineales bacterium]